MLDGWRKSGRFLKEIKAILKNNDNIPVVMRFYLVSFYDKEGRGSIWFNYDGFPSHLWIREQITIKYPQITKPAIMHIQELNEKNYTAFYCA